MSKKFSQEQLIEYSREYNPQINYAEVLIFILNSDSFNAIKEGEPTNETF